MAFPIANGKYEVSPGLKKLNLDKDFIFLKDEFYNSQIEERKKLIGDEMHSPVISKGFDKDVEYVLNKVKERYKKEYGHYETPQADLAIVKDLGETNKVIYLDVAFPNGWDPKEKIGKTFADVHKPVAHFEKMASMQQKIVRAMIKNGPFERYAWGVHTTSKLRRIEEKDDWSKPIHEIVFRMERQSTLGFPERGCALFTIHTIIKPLFLLLREEKIQLGNALLSMDEKSQKYKGMNPEAIERISSYLFI